MSAAAGWAARCERGSRYLVRLMTWTALTLGWHVARILLLPVTVWFWASSPTARAASRGFLGRALGRPPTGADVWRHFVCFASVILDRLYLLAGKTRGYRFDLNGLDSLLAVLAEGRGCLLLGSHLGSFEVLRALSRAAPVRIRPLMYLDNGGPLSRMLEQLDPVLARDVINIGTTSTMLEVRESVARGEMVGILGDRAPRDQKCLPTRFFGKPALLPTGPIILASMLNTPTFLFFGLRTGPRRYRVHLEPFADAIVLNRATRQADLEHWLARYAERLEAHARECPYNWFNFYDFWNMADGIAKDRAHHRLPARDRVGPKFRGPAAAGPI